MVADPSASSFLPTTGSDQHSLKNVRAVLFDQFGTLTDWQGSICRLLEQGRERRTSPAEQVRETIDWLAFTQLWRDGYMKRTREIASGGTVLAISTSFTLSLAGLEPGLEDLRKLDPPVLLATLSNGTLRLLVDVSRHNSFPLDAHFSGDLLSSYKPNPKMYCGASSLLGFDEDARRRGEVAMFASHIDDLRAAGQHGSRTIYIRRATEDVGIAHGGASSEA
ncbi:haloacid dehalogenase, type II [Rhodotorula toruloides]|uniref:Haloacid dehalogenase, type II n=1 Tax=Rhodotorula toruloides TaxID=5286 RepID=A0A511KSH1_RHOTO|nr:haloacid dehalogenase, type II [Rhodotorula toruloides]